MCSERTGAAGVGFSRGVTDKRRAASAFPQKSASLNGPRLQDLIRPACASVAGLIATVLMPDDRRIAVRRIETTNSTQKVIDEASRQPPHQRRRKWARRHFAMLAIVKIDQYFRLERK